MAKEKSDIEKLREVVKGIRIAMLYGFRRDPKTRLHRSAQAG